jgi:hypothetical protein
MEYWITVKVFGDGSEMHNFFNCHRTIKGAILEVESDTREATMNNLPYSYYFRKATPEEVSTTTIQE